MTALDKLPFGTAAAAAERASLSLRARTAGIWSLGGHGVSVFIRFAVSLIMSRLLAPDMFALMAIASVILTGLTLLSDVGLGPNIIRSKLGAEPNFLNTAWSIQIIRGFLIWAIASTISVSVVFFQQANLITHQVVYGDSRLPYVMVAISFGAVIAGFNSTKLYEVRRGLQFSRLTVIEVAAQLVGVVCTLGWVFWSRSVWALVAGTICASFTTMILSHAWLPGTKNRLTWDKTAAHEIILFGMWIFLSSAVFFLASNSDRLLLGGLIDVNLLGVYSIAINIYSAFDQVMSRMISGVAYPALSEVVRERPSELKRAYYRVHNIVSIISYFCGGLLMVAGSPIVHFFYDVRYAQAGWMLEILAVGVLVAPSQIAVQCFLALGMPKLGVACLVVRLTTLLIAMPIGFLTFGVPGALAGFAASWLATLPIIAVFRVRYGLLDVRQELRTLPVIIAGMLAGGVLAVTL